MVMKKILVPTDFTENAQNAFDLAFEVARDNKAKMYLLHVVEYPIGATIDPIGVSIVQPTDTQLIDELTNNAREKLKTIEEKLVKDGMQVETSVDLGNAYLNIVDKVKDGDIDMVIMGSHGASGFKEFIIGSNAEKVVRHATCPVITIKQPLHINDVNSIVYASDFNDVSKDVIMNLKQLQRIFNAKIHFVRINTPNNFEKDRVMRRLIENLIEKNEFLNCDYTIYNDIYEEDGLINFAEDIKADMIAMATHGRTGISHLISGSIAEDVVNHAKRPVWTYHIGKK